MRVLDRDVWAGRCCCKLSNRSPGILCFAFALYVTPIGACGSSWCTVGARLPSRRMHVRAAGHWRGHGILAALYK